MTSNQSYHMLSYILENGAALSRTLRQSNEDVQRVAAEARRRGCTRIVLSGAGSSYSVAWVAKPAFDTLVAEPTHVIPATELAHHRALLDEKTLVVVLSASGGRKCVIDGLRAAEESGAFTVAVTGVADSPMAQNASRSLVTAEGPEVSFPTTKSVTTGIGVFISLALALCNRADANAGTLTEALHKRVPELIDQALETAAPQVERLLDALPAFNRLIVAGTAGNSGVAMEVALTIQESALVTTQWADTGNLFHGALCPLNKQWLVALMVTPEDLELSSDTLRLVKALGGYTLGLLPPDLVLEPMPDYVLSVPAVAERIFSPLVYLPVMQLLAYHWTVLRGFNPDAPPGSEVILEALLPSGSHEPEPTVHR